MALLLSLFTHLCVHILGLTGNSIITLIISIVALFAYGLSLLLLPAIWPGQILHDALTRIEAMETRLHDEATRRRLLDMYNLSTYGLRGLTEYVTPAFCTGAARLIDFSPAGRLKLVHNRLADRHRAHLADPLSYAREALALCKSARRCKHDVEVLCLELTAAVRCFADFSFLCLFLKNTLVDSAIRRSGRARR
jgi:hypothetical protein